MRFIPLALVLAPVSAAMIVSPAMAQQQSESYKFLKAIEDADGNTVVQMLDKPGQRVVNAKDRMSGEGAVHILARNGNTQFLRYILAKGANPDLRDAKDNTAAIIAVQSGNIAALNALSDYKANFNLANRQGQTPLIVAVLARRADMVQILLAAGADPDQADSLQGMSARDYAKRDTRSPELLKLIQKSDSTRKPKAKVYGPSL